MLPFVYGLRATKMHFRKTNTEDNIKGSILYQEITANLGE